MADRLRVGLVGARGHVGAELVPLLVGHPDLELVFVSSRQLAGKPLAELLPGASAPDLRFEDLLPAEAAARRPDAVILALPNGLSEPWAAALPDATLVDLSADHRFDDDWVYGLVELRRERIRGARRIANPGCYATAAQIALWPLRDDLTDAPRIFAVSGYSGAGSEPSPKNDPEVLRDNLLPYALVEHVHEREIGRQLGRPVRFLPHVAPFFRGIGMTIDCAVGSAASPADLFEWYRARYRDEPLVRVSLEPPLVRDVAGKHHVAVGGFACADGRAVVVATIDNLLKGAATQALQNLNLGLGLDENRGLERALS
jgi:N-acetyl-gamma-glutamyl-phosphate reductase